MCDSDDDDDSAITYTFYSDSDCTYDYESGAMDGGSSMDGGATCYLDCYLDDDDDDDDEDCWQDHEQDCNSCEVGWIFYSATVCLTVRPPARPA